MKPEEDLEFDLLAEIERVRPVPTFLGIPLEVDDGSKLTLDYPEDHMLLNQRIP